MLYFVERLGILSKVKGEDILLSKFSKLYKFISIVSFAIAAAISFMYYKANIPNAYEIRVFDKVVAYVGRDKDMLSDISKAVNKIDNRFTALNLKDNITVFNSKVTEDYLIDDKLIEKAIVQNGGVEVEALSMLCDNKEIAIVASEAEGKEALEKVKNYYSSKSGVNVKESKIKNKITYVRKKVPLKEVDNVDEISNRIIESNSKLKNPLLVVEIKGTRESRETVSPKTVIKTSSSLLVGQSKVESQGKSGEKAVVKEVTIQNGKVITSRIISEKITTYPEDKIIVKGSKSSESVQKVANTFLATPSRGRVSSNFGMRWGKMHQGLDIAANIGTPIYAALDGTVTYSGWATGYGNLVKLKHDGGVETYYGHCSKLLVAVGDTVKKGEKIAEVGSTGNSTGPHVHFEVRVNGVAKDPTKYLKDIKAK